MQKTPPSVQRHRRKTRQTGIQTCLRLMARPAEEHKMTNAVQALIETLPSHEVQTMMRALIVGKGVELKVCGRWATLTLSTVQCDKPGA